MNERNPQGKGGRRRRGIKAEPGTSLVKGGWRERRRQRRRRSGQVRKKGVTKDSDTCDRYTDIVTRYGGNHRLEASNKEKTTNKTVEENVIKIRTPN